jgi:hypothetical protein
VAKESLEGSGRIPWRCFVWRGVGIGRGTESGQEWQARSSTGSHRQRGDTGGVVVLGAVDPGIDWVGVNAQDIVPILWPRF